MSSPEYVAAPRAVTVLPTSANRRLTRRDGLLPLVLAFELLTGVAFGLAGHAGSSDAQSVPARIELGAAPLVPVAASSGLLVTAQPALQPVALVVLVRPTVGAVAPAAQLPIGPPIGPLRPGTVRGALPAAVAPAEVAPVLVTPVVVVPPPPARHAPRDPFAALVKAP